MFANLIESQSHGKEFKRRGRFVIATAAAYAVLFFVAGIVSIYAYDARVEAQTDELEIVNWVPPVDRVIADPVRPAPPIRRTVPSSAPPIRAQGPVSVQSLIDEQGRVISAQAMSGSPTLLSAAKEAAMRARFTPTLLSGTPVKVQGTIIYNFVLQ